MIIRTDTEALILYGVLFIVCIIGAVVGKLMKKSLLKDHDNNCGQ